MNALFEFKKQYLFKASPIELNEVIEKIVNNEDYGLDKNITGKTVSSYVYLLRLMWVPMADPTLDPVYLKVEISQINEFVIIKTLLKPNIYFVLLFYFCILFILFGITFYLEFILSIILIISTIILIFGGIIGFFMIYLRRCLEKIIEVNGFANIPITSATHQSE